MELSALLASFVLLLKFVAQLPGSVKSCYQPPAFSSVAGNPIPGIYWGTDGCRLVFTYKISATKPERNPSQDRDMHDLI